jgi:hypothetical protein
MEINISQDQTRVPVTVFKVSGRINRGNAESLIKQAEQGLRRG